MSLITVAVLAAFAFYVMTPEERLRLARAVLLPFSTGVNAAAERATKRADPFTDALRERTRYALVTPAIAGINIMVFLVMAVGPGALGDADTLVAWGGNFGPKTTNAEWGRLLVSMFVHAGPLHLLATLAGLVQAGLIMERLAGPVTFSAVYGMAGFFASAVSLWMHPTDVSVGASGAVFGIVGFLAATSVRGLQSSSGVMIPLQTVRTFAPAAAVFVVYNVLGGGLRVEADLAGCLAGFVSGLVLTRDIAERTPRAPRVVAAVAATFTIAAAIAVPLYGIIDVRPEIERMVRLEDGTAARYRAAVERFRRGVIPAKELARVIERNIVPELRSARSRLTSLGRIAREDRPIVVRAQEFLRLREQSWEVRAKALEVGNMAMLRQADLIEMSSLQTLASIKPPVQQ